jgi:glycosyltransferase involved in cell wall biosynthesis
MLGPPDGRLRILTTHPKDHHPVWRERTEILAGWLEEAARTGDTPMSWWQSLRWGIRLFRASRGYDAVGTGFERSWWVFAALQGLLRTRRVPHVMVYISFVLPRGRVRRRLKRLYYRHLFYPLMLRHVDRVVVYSRRQIGLYARTLGLPSTRFAHVPYHTTLYDMHCPVTEGDYVFAGGDFTRDYTSLIEAVRGLSWRLVIAARFRHYFQGIELPPNVEVVTTTRQGFFDLMAGAGVVAVPLRGGLLHSGGQQTYLNAMLMGKPVVVTDDCGADEYFVHQDSAVLLRPGDVTGLRAAITTLMVDRNRAREMGRRARAAAEAHSPEQFLGRVLALVAECARRDEPRVRPIVHAAGGPHAA